MFVLSIICFILALVGVVLAFVVGTGRHIDKYEGEVGGSRKWYFLGAGIALVLGIVFLIFSSTFQVDTGSSKALKDWSGIVAPEPVTEPGFHTKAPWQDDVPWDVKSKSIMFSGDGSTSHENQNVVGAEITFTDKDGISANLDIQVVFSIKAKEIVRLTGTYGTQANFESTIVENDVKSLPRDVAAGYTTVQMFEKRAQFRADVVDLLEKTWADEGIIVDKVNIHGIRYPDEVKQRFQDAQNAKTNLLTAETDALTAKAKADGEAQAAISKASGEAEANRLLAASLTPQILQQRWIDAVAKSGTVIVPQDFTSLGNLSPQR